MSGLCRVLVVALAALAVLAPVASGAERAHALDGSEVNPWNAFFLERTKPILPQPGLGPIWMPVSTDDEAALFWFNQGLAQLFGFAHEDAIYSFRRALDHDGDLAMAYWGMAWAFGANINLDADRERALAAYRNARKALRRAGPASARERAYIDAIQDRYVPGVKPIGDGDRGDRDEQFYFRMRDEVSAKHPDDLHAAALAAEAGLDLHPWNAWTKEGVPVGHTLEVVRILRGVLDRDPHHVGAQHYLIHGVEASPSPADGLLAAERIKSDAWGQPHLVHAASHIYARTGDWGSAQISGEDAEHQDELYLLRNGTNNLYTLAHGSHNIHFEASVMSMGGRRRLAIANARELRRKVEPYLGRLPALEFYQPYEILMRTRFADWRGVLAMRAPRKDLLGARALRHYARGVAHARSGRVDLARRERGSLALLHDRIARTPNYPDFNLNKVQDVTGVALEVLDGRIAWAAGDGPAAIAQFREAVRREDLLHYDEPPPWYFPSGELLGAALLSSGRPDEAEAAFRAVLEDYPRDGWALFGLAEALRAQGRPAADAESDFADAWRWADRPLTRQLLL